MSVDIVGENARLDGRTTFDQINTTGFGDINAQGFARQPSVNIGETMEFSVNGGSTTIDIYRVGWYGGSGFRLVASIANTPTNQPEATEIPDSYGGTTCTDWTVTASWAVPESAVSGLYVALIRSVPPNAPNAFYATFVVRDDDAVADITYKTSDATWWVAYNHYGTKANINGKNLYGAGTGVGSITDRCTKVDYHRPVITRSTVSQTFWMACELPLIRWLERNGYSVKYITCVDLDRGGVGMLLNSGIFLSSGHDEYWSQPMWDAVETYRDDFGGHSIFMSGNEVFWRVRFEYEGDRTVMVCYKDTMPGPSPSSHVAGEPLDPVSWTGTWMDTRWPDAKDGAFLTGTKFGMNGVWDYDAFIPQNPYGGLKVWGGSSLVDGQIVLQQMLGFEADHLYPTQPEESVRILAAYTRSAPGGLSDANGQNYNVPGNIVWGIIAQRYSSGAMTVGFGTCQWSWVLDNTHDRGLRTTANRNAQQFTVNLLRDLGAEASSLQGDVVLQQRNLLSDYALIPGQSPEDPEEPEEETKWRRGDGAPLDVYVMIDGTPIPVS